MDNLETLIHSYSLTFIGISCVILVLLAVFSLTIKPLSKLLKKLFFFGIVLSVILPTLFLIVSTVYLNSISASGGPVHWHADLEVWACGKQLELRDPVGFSNKIGTAVLHEHNDKRIHMEGVVIKNEDASLTTFFDVIGGELTEDSMRVPTTNGVMNYQSNDLCPAGNTGIPQIFVYTTQDKVYSQKKVTPEHVMSPYSAVPEGDCVIVEFDAPKDRTEHLCKSYQVAEQVGKLEGEKRDGS